MWRGVKTVMLLHQYFNHCCDIEHFVKANSIQKGNIQTIFYSPKDNRYHLFYWG